MASPGYRNFRVAVYIPAGVVNKLGDPELLARQWETLTAEVRIDKVYIEYTRDRQTVDETVLDQVKTFFLRQGVQVAGGLTLSDCGWGQFRSLCYVDPEHREFVRRVSETVACYFDEVILDDFFFVTTKSADDIAQKGTRSWSRYRLDTMNDASRSLVVGPAKMVNPNVKMVVKFPNWYEHFAALGYDLEQGPRIFDGIYTGTETREPVGNDQCLQQYESYLVYRYFCNVLPGGNGGGWVDTFGLGTIDRYAEQLWDTAFAKAPEITLFNWNHLLDPVEPGARARWQALPTSLNWDEMLGYRAHDVDGGGSPPTLARAAGYSLEQVDRVVGELGRPLGVASYRPHHATGEDFLHNYLGMIGIPIELYPEFPAGANVILLTESAKCDEDIIGKIKGALADGKHVVITSGLLSALEHWGISDIADIAPARGHITAESYSVGFGPGERAAVAAPQGPPIDFPRVRFATNDTWPLVSVVSDGVGFPLFMMNRYAEGVLFVWTMPHNPRHLYRLPPEVTKIIKHALMKGLFVRLDGPGQVALFAYDNDTFVVQSFLDAEVEVRVSVAAGRRKIRDVLDGTVLTGTEQPLGRHDSAQLDDRRVGFDLTVMPHSYRVFAVEE